MTTSTISVFFVRDMNESDGHASWHPPKRTGWKHVQTYGSADERHVSEDDKHSCLRLRQLIRLKWVIIINKNFNHNVCPCLRIGAYYFTLKINHMKVFANVQNIKICCKIIWCSLSVAYSNKEIKRYNSWKMKGELQSMRTGGTAVIWLTEILVFRTMQAGFAMSS
jgi:hypothetical protein